MASEDSYIGSLISLTSKSEIRYEGILYNINTEECSIGLRNGEKDQSFSKLYLYLSNYFESFGTEVRNRMAHRLLQCISFREGMDSTFAWILDPRMHVFLLHIGTCLIGCHTWHFIKISILTNAIFIEHLNFLSSYPFLEVAFLHSIVFLLVYSLTAIFILPDLQVKASPPVQTPPPINNDPAIIQSQYTRPTTQSTNLSSGPSGSLADIGSHSHSWGLPGSTFQSGLPLYQPGAPNASGSGLAGPIYWQGFYGALNGLPQLPQQSFFQTPPSFAIPPSMQPMQFSSFGSSLPMEASSLPTSNFLEYHCCYFNLYFFTFILVFECSPFASRAAYTRKMSNLLPNKDPISAMPTSTLTSNLQILSPFSGLALDNAGLSSVANKPMIPGPGAGISSVANKPTIPGPVPLTHLTISQPLTSVALASGSLFAETSTPSHITPGPLQKSGQSIVSPPQTLLTSQKDVKVVQVLPQPSLLPILPLLQILELSRFTEAQLPILPLLPNTRALKCIITIYFSTRAAFLWLTKGMQTNYHIARPVRKFTEEFDFMAVNEKFIKDKVWGHLGKCNQSQSKYKVLNESGSDEYDSPDEYDTELSKIEKPVYKKNDFFDSLSCNALDNNPNYGRTRYSEQTKLDSETLGDFSRYRGCRGSVQGGGSGRFRGSYYGGRGYGGYGYTARGRDRGLHT
ncbi:LOW QUALITY PROTEIN: protein decapping 5-like [Primulina eburnea]|uniref:LOW QUALITY PROTEIN: protein decapping 5-like n=1 Tax=Primulina eburnea TaxID=1245227 RepID=UPI003C6BE9B5